MSYTAAHYNKKYLYNRIWRGIVSVLASIVVFCTTYALILPAITMGTEPICGFDEHLHNSECYSIPALVEQYALICSADNLALHTHTETCYDDSGRSICGYASYMLHTHDEGCYDPNSGLVCSLPEIKAHVHDESCWQQPHVHNEACSVLQQGELICLIEEGTVHTHTDDCYTSKQTLLCSREELPSHIHGEGCYTETSTQICAQEEVEGHTHGTECYDETGTTFVCPLPEIAGHIHTEECFTVSRDLTCGLEEIEGHTHVDTCWLNENELTCTETEGVAHIHREGCYACVSTLTCTELTAEEGVQSLLICEQPELVPHIHEDICYLDGVLICSLLQIEEHIHSDLCFTVELVQPTEQALTCTLAEHTHNEACYPAEETPSEPPPGTPEADIRYCGLSTHTHRESCADENGMLLCTMTEHEHDFRCDLPPADPTDVESADIWEATLPELTGDQAADLTAVAQSQLGYVQSSTNYVLTETSAYFYNRYAAWRSENDPYAPMDTAFAAFCLHYANAQLSAESDFNSWLERMFYYQYTIPTGDQPLSADVAFLADGTVAIVTDVTEYGFTAILPREGAVIEQTFATSEVLAFARIPGNEPAEPDPAVLAADELLAALPSAEDIRIARATYESDPEALMQWEAALNGQIEVSQAAFDALTPEQQAQLTQVRRLTDAQAALAEGQLTPEQQLEIEDLAFLMGMLPTLDEIEHNFDELAATGDAAGLAAYRQKIHAQVKACFDLADSFTDAQKAAATGLDVLENYRYLLEMDPDQPVASLSAASPDGKTTASVVAQWAVPVGAEFVIRPVENTHSLKYSAALSAVAGFVNQMDVDLLEMMAMDMHFADQNGTELPAQGMTTVTLDFPQPILPGEGDIYVLHITDDGTAENVTQSVVRDENGVHSVTFTTDGFSEIVTARAVGTTLTVTMMNGHNDKSGTLILYHKNAGASISDFHGMKYTWQDVVVVEEIGGTLTVTEVHPSASGSNKQSVYASGNGFILVKYGTLSMEVGDTIVAGSDFWRSETREEYDSTGHGTLTYYSSAEAMPKPAKNNNLCPVTSADTDELIQVNLYDYGTNINTIWKDDNNQPGFQYPGGSDLAANADKFGRWNMAFGDNIVADETVETTVTKDPAVGTVNGTGTNFVTGAINKNLSADGYPVLTYQNSELDWLFSQNPYATKMNDKNINGLFRQNSATGLYTYNSRENHAQFDAATDTFTLYDKWLTSNFVTYPFGNFLPFNNIDTQASYAPNIDRQWFVDMAAYAQYQYNQSPTTAEGARYSKLANAMRGVVNVMDSQKGNQTWTGADVLSAYFAIESIPDADALENLSKIYTIDYDEETDFFFGMDMSMDFMMPKNGTVVGPDEVERDMVFEFIGDDDVWVYIDGMLFLDLTGIHRHRGGTIDFANGLIHYYNLDKSTGDISSTPMDIPDMPLTFEAAIRAACQEKGMTEAQIEAYLEENLAKNSAGQYTTFKNYTVHKFKFFYMERGSGSSVCEMNFNLPVVRENSLAVTKELTGGENSLGNPDFYFQVVKRDDNQNVVPLLEAVKEFRVLDAASGQQLRTDKTNDTGVFRLKAGEMAIFDVRETAQWIGVRELLHMTLVDGQYRGIYVDGQSVQSDHGLIVGQNTFVGTTSTLIDIAESAAAFTFDNHVNIDEVGGLYITKSITDLAPGATGEEIFDMQVWLDNQPVPQGTPYTITRLTGVTEQLTMGSDSTIRLKTGETAYIGNILAGTWYRVKETASSMNPYSSVDYVVTAANNGQIVKEIHTDTDGQNYVTGPVGTKSHAVTVTAQNETETAAVTLYLEKRLINPGSNSDNEPFTFRVTLKNADGTPYADKSLTLKYGTVQEHEEDMTNTITRMGTDANGQIELDIPHGWVYDIVSLPKGVQWTIEELSSAGYAVSYTVTEYFNTSGPISGTGATAQGVIPSQRTEVVFTNVAGYRLPNTGGDGKTLPVPLGLGIIACAVTAIVLVNNPPCKRGRREAE